MAKLNYSVRLSRLNALNWKSERNFAFPATFEVAYHLFVAGMFSASGGIYSENDLPTLYSKFLFWRVWRQQRAFPATATAAKG
jgi:hypothetical protein